MIKTFQVLSLLMISLLINKAYASSYKSPYKYTTDKYHSYNVYDNAGDVCSEIDDPYEKLNRKIFIFNSVLDAMILKPIAKGYKAVIPEYGQARIGNMLDNLKTPPTFVNNSLQLKPQQTLTSFWRFVINSTLGVGGLFDIASRFGIQKHEQNFGATLARYGVAPGPYLVLPIFGPSSARDAMDYLVGVRINPVKWHTNKYQDRGIEILSTIHRRAGILEFTEHVLSKSPDPYVTLRSIYYQHREQSLQYPPNMKKKCAPEFYKN